MSKPTGYAITRQEVVRMVHFLSSFCDDSTCPHMCAGPIELTCFFFSRGGLWIQMEAAMILSDLRKIFRDVLSFFGTNKFIH